MASTGTDERSSQPKRLERRRFLKGLGATAGISTVAGCTGLANGTGIGSNTGGETGGDPGDTQIEYWMYFGAEEKREMTNLVRQFNSKDNGIHVTPQSVPFSSFLTKLFTAVKSDTAPHVASYYASYGYYLQDVCQPIDQYLSNGTKKEYFETAWDNLQVNGSTYALPIDIHGKALFTNDTLLNEAGVKPNFTSWSKFREACNTIKQQTDARPFSFLNSDGGMSALRTFIIALNQAGGSVLAGKPGDQNVVVDTDAGVKTAELMASITGERNWDVPRFPTPTARVKDFLSDDLAMYIGGTWGINLFENESGEIPDDLDFSFHKPFFFPGKGNDVAWAESNSLYVPRNKNHTEKEKQAAVKFAEYVTQNNPEWATAGGHLPAAKSVATSQQVMNSKLWQKYGTISTMYEMVKDEQVQYQPMSAVDLNSERFWSPLVDMYLQNMEPETGLQNAANTLQNALEAQ